ncbi:uncharacterized protein LOC107418575 [Ziziphus jujuba]|uniref:Uncharacterized protein LOC107418575 n=1 Tax=Ziziphus jujuba TaxID=326968 RepID=A0ABM3IJ30_ZIZJJ|nr:uncharacterized protein LOC107418575 [Ziziphus jujuba]
MKFRKSPQIVPLNCTAYNLTQCSSSYNPTASFSKENRKSPSPCTCPEYFRWINEDLRPWANTGISKYMIERAQEVAHFRLVIVNGKAYVETYRTVYQSRDKFTLWGILQLLRRYPGKVPDLDLMFFAGDMPDHLTDRFSGPNDVDGPPPLFRYCNDNVTGAIVFPDWSFWGWPEVNIKPWESLVKELEDGNKRIKWVDRENYAYWKGNPGEIPIRHQLLKCNVSDKQDWNVRSFVQDWRQAFYERYKYSNLANQCIHKFKIYVEGRSWSVSEKYILACDSLTLFVKPNYFDFFTRSLMPLQHYWPIRNDDICRSIKFAVDWSNTHPKEAQDIGKAASKFIVEELKMENVYDYMFHVLNEYAKLLNFKPTIPQNATELCLEALACPAETLKMRNFMVDSMVKTPAQTSPCIMPPPYTPPSLNDIRQKKASLIKQVEMWEKNYREYQTN